MQVGDLVAFEFADVYYAIIKEIRPNGALVVFIDDLDFVENTSEELYNGMIEYLDLFQDQNQKILKFENNQIKVNEFLKFRLEEIYNEEVVKKNYFKENNWKKNEFLRIIKRFKSCQGTYTNSSIS